MRLLLVELLGTRGVRRTFQITHLPFLQEQRLQTYTNNTDKEGLEIGRSFISMFLYVLIMPYAHGHSLD